MGKIKDITGQTFGELTVIENVGKPQGERVYHWRCICSCGKEVTANGALLRSGGKKSCGCLLNRGKDITNQRFGKLVALKRLEEKKKGIYLWECKCDCGNIIKTTVTALNTGNTTSCGCGKYDGLKKYNLEQSESNKLELGTRFGKLVVIEDLGFREYSEGHKRRWYKCQCDCGEVKEVNGNLLKQGQVHSCGNCIASLGEYQIQQILNYNNINYCYDVQLPELTKETGRRLRFDFIIYDSDFEKPIRFVEFDGRQHFSGPEANWSNSDSLEKIQERDEIKNKFCLSHKYPLVRIPYTKLNYITLEDILGDKYIVKGDDLS